MPVISVQMDIVKYFSLTEIVPEVEQKKLPINTKASKDMVTDMLQTSHIMLSEHGHKIGNLITLMTRQHK